MNDELNGVARPLQLATTVFHGGAPYGPQEGALRNGIDVLVATPGRIMDHLSRGSLKLDQVGGGRRRLTRAPDLKRKLADPLF